MLTTHLSLSWEEEPQLENGELNLTEILKQNLKTVRAALTMTNSSQSPSLSKYLLVIN